MMMPLIYYPPLVPPYFVLSSVFKRKYKTVSVESPMMSLI